MGLFIASPFSPHLKTALIRTQEALRTRGVRRQFTGGTPAATVHHRTHQDSPCTSLLFRV